MKTWCMLTSLMQLTCKLRGILFYSGNPLLSQSPTPLPFHTRYQSIFISTTSINLFSLIPL